MAAGAIADSTPGNAMSNVPAPPWVFRETAELTVRGPTAGITCVR